MNWSEQSDEELVRAALLGNRAPVEVLLERLQGPLYRLAVRMLWDPRDAEEATQEILVRVVTRLSTFREESRFRTWAWRVAVNHLRSVKRSKAEEAVHSFDCYAGALAAAPDQELADDQTLSPEQAALVEEARVGCTLGMLLCLGREQRLTFVLGEIFELSDREGAEVLGESRAAFRQSLSRARRQLEGFMAGHCGYADPKNPCRCARKTRAFIAQGIVDPQSLRFVPSQMEVVRKQARELGALFEFGVARIYREQSLEPSRDLAADLRLMLASEPVRRVLQLEES